MQVPEWDFRVFWLHAQLAARGLDFYDRELVRGFLASVHASPQLIEVGRFWNPPQAMLFFLPLGHIDDLTAAYAVWVVIQICALAACAALLARGGEPLACVALLLAIRPTTTIFLIGQTNFLVLLLLLAYALWRERLTGGVALAAGIVLKPLLAFLLIDAVLRKRGRALAGIAAGMVALTALSIAVFGWDVHLHYLRHGAGEVPKEMLTMPQNQSLLAVLLRAGMPKAVFFIAAIAALWFARTSLLALVAAALLLYPQTLDHYGVLLIVPVIALWRTGETASAVVACLVHALAPFTAIASALALAWLALRHARGAPAADSFLLADKSASP